jgi:Mce-associated membrane protein
MAKQNRRRPSSANPTSRPRRLAGRTGSAPPVGEPGPTEPDEPTGVSLEKSEPVPAPEAAPQAGPDPEPEPELEPEPEVEQATAPPVGFVGSPRTTRTLLILVVVLAVATLAGGIFLWVHDDDEVSTASDTGSPFEADAETPVRITGEDAQVAVAAAAQAAYTIVATSYEDYAAQVDEAAELMTPTFAEEYRRTADDVADAIVSSKTEVQVSVVAQGVVRADQEQVQALVFLNQFVTKDGKEPVFTPYRALVTVVNTDQGWLVSDLDTK